MEKKFVRALPVLILGLAFAGTAFADTSMTGTGMTTTSMSSGSMMSGTMSTTDLMVGSNGDGVTWLQNFLIGKQFLTLSNGATGYFGPITMRALASYQASVGLPAHGYYGALTRAQINGAMAMNTNTSSTSMTSGSSMNTSTSAGVMVGGALMVPNLDIVQNAVNASNVTTVVAAVKAAGLVPTLESTGPFTVFAPDNNAFAKLPAGTVSTLLMPANLATLKDILTYHVVSGAYTSKTLYDGEVLTTVEGKTITIGKSASGQITVNGTAMVETPDVISKNGVTFVIDTVLMPPSK